MHFKITGTLTQSWISAIKYGSFKRTNQSINEISLIFAGLGMSMCAAGTLGIVRHYFDRRQGAAFAGIGLGAGIAQVSLPPICSTLLTKYGYKYAWLYISPLFLLNLLPPLLFIEQIPLNKPKSAKALLTSYVDAFKHYITPFFLLNSLFARGAQLGILVLLFGHLSITTTPEIALKAYVVCGFGFLVSTLSCNLILLKFNLNCFVTLIVLNLAIGLTCCMLAALNIPLVYYIFCGIFGLTNGAALAVKGGVSIHLYPPDAIEYSYGLSEAVAGIGSFVFPYVGGYIQKQYSSSSSGIYFHAAAVTLGGLILILAALIRPALWKLPQHRHTKPEKSDEDFTTSGSESSEHSSESTADIDKENPLGQCKVTGLVGRGI